MAESNVQYVVVSVNINQLDKVVAIIADGKPIVKKIIIHVQKDQIQWDINDNGIVTAFNLTFTRDGEPFTLHRTLMAETQDFVILHRELEISLSGIFTRIARKYGAFQPYVTFRLTDDQFPDMSLLE